jgi:hypothetical protein
MFEFISKLGKKEVYELNKFNTFKKSAIQIFLIPIGLICFFLLQYLISNEALYLVFIILFGICFPVILFLTMYLMVWFYIRSSKIISDDNIVYLKFNDNEVEIKTEKPDIVSLSNMKWNMVYKGYETKKYYFLYISNRQSYIVPKNTITSGKNEDFSLFLKKKLGKNYIKR